MVDDRALYPADPADELAATVREPVPGEVPPAADKQVLSGATQTVNATNVEASLSALASTHTDQLTANGSALGLATIAGDAEIGTSAVGIVAAKGRGSVKQSYVSSFVGGEQVHVDQSATAAVIARTVSFERSGALVTLSGDAEVSGGVVGVLLSGRANVSENARVLLTGKALAILALVLFGGLGLVAVAVYFGAKEIAARVPKLELQRWMRSR